MPVSASGVRGAVSGGAWQVGLSLSADVGAACRCVAKHNTVIEDAGLSKPVDLKLVGRTEYDSGAVAMRLRDPKVKAAEQAPHGYV